MTERETQLFYHGTPVAVHESERPFLEPRLAPNRDRGDPDKPFICVTPWQPMARVYTQKSPDAFGMSVTSDGVHILAFSKKPENLHRPGYVYRFQSPEHGVFESLTTEGKTGEWVAYTPLGVRAGAHETVHGLRQLMQDDKLQVLYLRESADLGRYMAVNQSLGEGRSRLSLFADCIDAGIMGHLNMETGHMAYRFEEHRTSGLALAQAVMAQPHAPVRKAKPSSPPVPNR